MEGQKVPVPLCLLDMIVERLRPQLEVTKEDIELFR